MKKFLEKLKKWWDEFRAPSTPVEPVPPIVVGLPPVVIPGANGNPVFIGIGVTKAAFLFPAQPGDKGRNDTLVAFSEETSDAQFERSLRYMRGIGANAYVVVLVNPGQATYKRTPYKNGWGGDFDEAKLARWERRTKQIVAAGLRPVFLMFSSLNESVRKKQAEHERCITRVMGRLDAYGPLWGVGLEVSEFWKDADYVGEIAGIMQRFTMSPVGTHSEHVESGTPSNIKWFAYELWQPDKGDGKSAADCVKMIQSAQSKLKKFVIAGEYNSNSSGNRAKEQGRACLEVGAVGAWNGF